MIRSFKDSDTERLFHSGRSRYLPPDIQQRAILRLRRIDVTRQIEDLREPPSHRLEKLSGDRAGQWSIRINQQWRVCFRWEDGHAWDLEVVDYH